MIRDYFIPDASRTERPSEWTIASINLICRVSKEHDTFRIWRRGVISIRLDMAVDRSVIANVWIRQVRGVIGQDVIKFHHVADNHADVNFHG